MSMITEKKFKNRRLISAKMGAYDFVYNIPEFMKRKRNLQCVILADKALKGLKCSVCKKTFDLTNKDEGSNRTDIIKKEGNIMVSAVHYSCSWKSLLHHVYVELPKRMGM